MTVTVDEGGLGAERAGRSAWRIRPDTYAVRASGGRWKRYRYLRRVADEVYGSIRAGDGRLLVSAPPRHGKSEFLAFWLPVWFLDRWPARRVILCSYADALAEEWGRRVRNELEQNELCLTTLARDSHAARRWHTPEGGGMVVAGVGGPVSGKGADLIIVDDPFKSWHEAWSQLIRRRVVEWFCGTLYTRCEPGATIVVDSVRWHESDLVGYLLREHEDRWRSLVFPALAEPGDELGRSVGEALCPERYDEAELAGIRRAVGGAVWPAEYQQRPAAVGIGRAYGQHTEDNIDDGVDLRPDLPLQVSVDFNSNPCMHLEVGQYDEVLDLVTATHEIATPAVRCAREAGYAFAELVMGELGGWRWPELHLFGDATGRAKGRDTAGGVSDWGVFLAAVRSRLPEGVEIRLRVPRANPPVVDRVDSFNEALRDVEGVVHYRHTRRCRRLLADFRELRTDEDGLPDKSDRLLSHASDAEGYRIHWLRPIGLGIFDEVGQFNV